MPERIAYTLVFRSPVGIFTGLGIAGLTDRTVVRGASGLPVIPGSTIKGRLRFFAQRALANGHAPEPFRLHGSDEPHCKDPETACTLCRLFGNPSMAALLRFSDAKPAGDVQQLLVRLREASGNPVVSADAEIRPGVAVSRRRRTALRDHLFFDETVGPLTFQGELIAGHGLHSEERAFLRGVGRMVDALGARKSSGRGALAGGIVFEGGD